MPMLCTSTFFRNKSISLGVKSKHSGFRLPSVCVCVYIYIYIYICQEFLSLIGISWCIQQRHFGFTSLPPIVLTN